MPADARSLFRAALIGEKDKRQSLPSTSKRKIPLGSEADVGDAKDSKRRRDSVERQTEEEESKEEKEWLRFQREVLLGSDQHDITVVNTPVSRSRFENATFHAMPVLNAHVNEGNTQNTPASQESPPGDTQVRLDDSTLEQREFLARLEEEERMQEESMQRVQVLRKRLASLRKDRLTKQSGK